MNTDRAHEIKITQVESMKTRLLDKQSIKLLPKVIYPKPLALVIKGLLYGYTYSPIQVRPR